jgi:HD-like signal output (HDOD) protein
VVQELIQTFDNQDINLDDIAKKIALDQTLSAKVLRLANSAHYSGSRSVSSIKDAVIMLGFNVLRTLVLSCGFVGCFKPPEGFDIKLFWKSSFQTAAICKWLARYCKEDGEVAFTAGLMHDIGSLLLHMNYPDQAMSIDRTVALGGRRSALESTLLGCNYIDVGSALASRWRFPQPMVEGIRQQESPLAGDGHSVLAGLIFIAQYLVHAMQAGATTAQMREHFPVDVADSIKLDTSAVLDNLDEVAELETDVELLLH